MEVLISETDDYFSTSCERETRLAGCEEIVNAKYS
jgi:hypothetical protein